MPRPTCPVCGCEMELIEGVWLCPYDPEPYEEEDDDGNA